MAKRTRQVYVTKSSNKGVVLVNAEAWRILTQQGENYVVMTQLEDELALIPVKFSHIARIHKKGTNCARIADQRLFNSIQSRYVDCEWNDKLGALVLKGVTLNA